MGSFFQRCDMTHCRFGITKSQICMVGDRLDTDILFGQNGGCRTLLVLSGEPSSCLYNSQRHAVTLLLSRAGS